MERLWTLIFVAFLAKGTEQQKFNVRTTGASSLETNEKDEIELNCVIRTMDRPTQFQWLLGDTVITNGSIITSQDDSGNYLLNFIERSTNVFDYHLTIRKVSRTHNGRWTCKATEDTGASKRINIVLTVRYVPDEVYPVCGVNDFSLTCESEEGNPRVSLKWYIVNGEERLNVKPSTVRTVDGIIHSEVRFSSLRPPEWMKEIVVCETDFGNCSISKEDVYNQTDLYIFKEEQENMVNVHCNLSNILNEGSLTFEQEDTSLKGKLTLQRDHATLSFKDEGFGYQEETIVCRYLWGIMDVIAVSLVVNLPIPSPLYSSTVVVTELTEVILSTESRELHNPTSDESVLHSSTQKGLGLETEESSMVTTGENPSTKLLSSASPHLNSDDHGLHSTVQMDMESETEEYTITTTEYSEETRTIPKIHTSSTREVVTTLEGNTPQKEGIASSTNSFTSKSSKETPDSDFSTTASTAKLKESTHFTNKLVTTLLMSSKSTDVKQEITSSSDVTPAKKTTMDMVTDKDDIQRSSTLLTLEGRTAASPATTNVQIVSIRSSTVVADKSTTLEAKSTLPLLPPESNVDPSDVQGWNFTLLLISLIVIFVVLLIAVIVYQKWKEKTGSYSLPNSASPNVKNSTASLFRPKLEYSY